MYRYVECAEADSAGTWYPSTLDSSSAMYAWTSKKLPDEERGGAEACLGASLLGVEDLLANCAPTALSKNPPPEEAGLEELGLEEEGLEEPGLEDGAGCLEGVSDFLAN